MEEIIEAKWKLLEAELIVGTNVSEVAFRKPIWSVFELLQVCQMLWQENKELRAGRTPNGRHTSSTPVKPSGRKKFHKS